MLTIDKILKLDCGIGVWSSEKGMNTDTKNQKLFEKNLTGCDAGMPNIPYIIPEDKLCNPASG